MKTSTATIAEKPVSLITDMLANLNERPRILDRDEAHHLTTVHRVLAELDVKGPSEAGDVIHSLLWRCAIVDGRARRFANELKKSQALAVETGRVDEEPASS